MAHILHTVLEATLTFLALGISHPTPFLVAHTTLPWRFVTGACC